MNSPAAVMTGHDDVGDLQNVHGVLQDRQTIPIILMNDICNIAMDEKLAGGEADNIIGWDPAVGAANPKVFRLLNCTETLEEIGVAPGLLKRPGPVVGEKLGEESHV